MPKNAKTVAGLGVAARPFQWSRALKNRECAIGPQPCESKETSVDGSKEQEVVVQRVASFEWLVPESAMERII